MADEGIHGVGSGEGLIPHESNPRSVEEDVRAAMDKATEAANAEGAPENAEDSGQPDLLSEEGAPAPETEHSQADKGDGAPTSDSEETEIGDLEPPQDWSAADQEVFRSIDKDTQQWLLDRDQAVRSAYEAQVKAAEPFQQVTQTWEPYLTQLGKPASVLVNDLINADYVLRRGSADQKRAMLGQIMRDYDIALEQQAAPTMPAEVADDPLAQAVNARLDQLAQGLQAVQSQMTTSLGNFQQQQVAAQQAELDAFRDAKDEKGGLKHPYFNEVRGLMDALADNAISAGQRPSLETVYEQACRAHPEVWAKMQSAERAAGILARQNSAKAKQAASKSVSSSPTGSRNPQAANDVPLGETAEETVRRAMGMHGFPT